VKEGTIHSKVIIVDEQSNGKIIIQQILKNYNPHINVIFFEDGETALAFLRVTDDIDLIITDFNIPEMNGIELVLSIRQLSTYLFVPIVMLTVDTNTETKHVALNAGVNAFLNRPIDDIECSIVCKNLLKLQLNQKIIANRSKWLSNNVHIATEQIEARERAAINSVGYLSKCKLYSEIPDFKRFRKIIYLVASNMGLSERECNDLEVAAPLYDIGMATINDALYLKESSLDPEEYNEIKSHTVKGHSILSENNSRYFQMAAKISLHHHEHYDGSGYPFGFKGIDIPLCARITAVADCLEAMQSERPYRVRYSFRDTVNYIQSNSGIKFDPNCVDVILNNQSELKKLFS